MPHLRPLRTAPFVLACAAAAAACGPSAAPPAPPRVQAPAAAPVAVPAPAPPTAPAPVPAATTPPDAPRGEVPAESRAPKDPPKPLPAAEAPPAAPAPAAPVVAEPARTVAPQIREAIAAARAKAAGGDGGGAIADLRDLEGLAGENADLRLEQGRIFLSLAEQGLARGDDSFLVKGLVADAHVRWKQATAMDPRVPGAAVLRARILRFEENPAAAKQILLDHLRTNPDDGEAHSLLGEMATAARDWQAADLHWTKAATADPSDGRARLQATIAKQWMRVPAEQIEAGYLEAARLLPDDGEPVRLLAQVHPNEREKKLELLGKVVAANPKAVTARMWIAHVLRTEGTPDLVRAAEVLREAARLAPANPDVAYNLALVHEQAGAPLDALRAYTDCVEKSEEGNCGRASDAIDRLLHAPDSPVAGSAPLSLRVRAMDAVCAKNPSEGRYGNNAGLWFRDVGRDYELSLKYYLRSCEAAPDDQDFLNDTGLIYLFHLTDRKEECRRYFDRVVALVEEEGQEPVRGYWDTLENLCKYWFDRGEYAKVVAIAKKRADPKASVNGAPYPSLRAAQYAAAAAQKLRDSPR